MRPIREGRSVALLAPTGTGKTLAYLLPLWERLVEAPRLRLPGPRLLVVAPSEDLQLQIGGVAQALAGPSAESAVLVMRRNLQGLEERLADAAAVVATPSLLLESANLSSTSAAWRQAAAGLQALVVDEADCLVPPGGARNSDLGRVLELLTGSRLEAEGGTGTAPTRGPPSPLQLVAASASFDAATLTLLEGALGIELELARVGAELPAAPSVGQAARAPPPQLGDAAVLDATASPPSPGPLVKLSSDEPDAELPLGVEHAVVITEGLLDAKGAVSRRALRVIVQTVFSLFPQRCLVVLAERRHSAERGKSLGKYLNFLRRQLAAVGFQLATASAVVAASNAPDDGGPLPRQVIVGRSEAIRGLDLAGVDAVVVVGELGSAREYLHVTGRTARWEPGRGPPAGGIVVSIVGRRMATVLKRWGKQLGFQLQSFRLQAMPDAVG